MRFAEVMGLMGAKVEWAPYSITITGGRLLDGHGGGEAWGGKVRHPTLTFTPHTPHTSPYPSSQPSLPTQRLPHPLLSLPAGPPRGQLKAIDHNCNDIPDAAMTAAVAALLADGQTAIRDVYNWRVKETERMKVGGGN